MVVIVAVVNSFMVVIVAVVNMAGPAGLLPRTPRVVISFASFSTESFIFDDILKDCHLVAERVEVKGRGRDVTERGGERAGRGGGREGVLSTCV